MNYLLQQLQLTTEQHNKYLKEIEELKRILLTNKSGVLEKIKTTDMVNYKQSPRF